MNHPFGWDVRWPRRVLAPLSTRSELRLFRVARAESVLAGSLATPGNGRLCTRNLAVLQEPSSCQLAQNQDVAGSTVHPAGTSADVGAIRTVPRFTFEPWPALVTFRHTGPGVALGRRSTMRLMSLRLYRRWKERRRSALDRYAEMSDEQREAIDRYKHRPKEGLPGATNAPRNTRFR